jgi:hypothetical protein
MTACSLSLSGYTGGGDDGADGGAPEGGDAANDAPGPGADASSGDGAPEGGDAGARFCATQPSTVVFCDDFERPDVQGPWDTSVIRPAGASSLALVPGTDGRGGSELLAFVPDTKSGPFVESDLHRDFGTVVNDMTYRYRFRLDAPPTDFGFQTLSVQLVYADGSFFSIFVFVQPDNLYLAEQDFPTTGPGGFATHPFSKAFSYGTWHDGELHIATAAPPHLTYVLDGVAVVDAAALVTLGPGKPSLRGGIAYADTPAGALSVRLDDVTFAVK